MFNNTTLTVNEGWCPGSCDRWICWPETPPGHNVTMDCPRNKGTLENATAYRYCDTNGMWETRIKGNYTYNYTHYKDCFITSVKELMKMCDEIGEASCIQIATSTRWIEMAGLSSSLVCLLVSLYIFFSYRVLKNNRTTIHKNLFIATLLQVICRLIIYIDQLSGEFLPFCLHVSFSTLLEYCKTAMFMWMFIEGLYLHNMITVTVFQEYTYIKLYYYLGWLVSGIMTAAWLTLMIIKGTQSTWPYYYFLSYYWILEGPRSAVIMVNFLFLLNIIRVLVVKLRESKTSEIEQVRKAVRAAIFLLPLMGVPNGLFYIYYLNYYSIFDVAWKFALWSYTTYFLSSFQGFFMAVLYCFLNGEVKAAIKKSFYSFYLRTSLRNYDYAPCRNFTIISIAADNGSVQKFRDSGRRDTATVITELTIVGQNAHKSTSRRRLPDETDTSLIEIKNSVD